MRKKKVAEPFGNDEWQALGDVEAPEKLSKEKFDRIKLAAGLDIPNDAIRRELGVSVETINAVLLVHTYEDYTK